MRFRKALNEDLDQIMAIFAQAQEDLKSAGVDQWQNGYPNHEIICGDILRGNSYVLEKDGQVLGTVALEFGGDPNYATIYAGAWLTDQPYGAIHRIAISREHKGLGLASKMIGAISKLCGKVGVLSIRVDTHEENKPMQSMLRKNGFEYCGIIYLADGAKRVAFEKVLRDDC